MSGYNHLFKFIVIGDSTVGKSSLLHRYCDDIFKIDNHYHTIGVDFKLKTVQIDGKTVKQQIWDIAGGQILSTFTCSYYRGAHGVMVAFDISDIVSFNNLNQWLQQIEKYADKDIPKVLVGLKSDLTAKRAMSNEVITSFANSVGIHYLEVSALSNINVNAAFDHLTKQSLAKIN